MLEAIDSCCCCSFEAVVQGGRDENYWKGRRSALRHILFPAGISPPHDPMSHKVSFVSI